jgi:hypothetical protein
MVHHNLRGFREIRPMQDFDDPTFRGVCGLLAGRAPAFCYRVGGLDGNRAHFCTSTSSSASTRAGEPPGSTASRGPWVLGCLEAFGSQRWFFGSNLADRNACTATTGTHLMPTATSSTTSQKWSRRNLLHANAEHIFRLTGRCRAKPLCLPTVETSHRVNCVDRLHVRDEVFRLGRKRLSAQDAIHHGVELVVVSFDPRDGQRP